MLFLIPSRPLTPPILLTLASSDALLAPPTSDTCAALAKAARVHQLESKMSSPTNSKSAADVHGDSNKLALIKPFVQKICTPTTPAKRLKAINSFFKHHSKVSFNHADYLYICKGLHYAVWYTELNKGCDEIIESIALHCGDNESLAVAMFQTLAIEWIGIDTYRVDKFAYLTRKITHQLLVKTHQNFRQKIQSNSDLISTILAKIEKAHGLIYHFITVFGQELVNVLSEDEDRSQVKIFVLKQLIPFFELMTTCEDGRTVHTVKHSLIFDLFIALIQNDLIKNPVKFRQQLCEFLLAYYELPKLSRKQKHVFESTISLLHSENHLKLVLAADEIASGSLKRKKRKHKFTSKRRRVNC